MSEELYHGGSPRVRREKNKGKENETVLEIDTEMLTNRFVDAAISAGVSYTIAKTFG